MDTAAAAKEATEIWGSITTQCLPFYFRPWVNAQIAQQLHQEMLRLYRESTSI